MKMFCLLILNLTPPTKETVINDYDNSLNDINLFFAKYPAVNGKALTIPVKENLFDTTDIDFKGRYKHTTLTSTQITSHATTMTTLIGGAGNSFIQARALRGVVICLLLILLFYYPMQTALTGNTVSLCKIILMALVLRIFMEVTLLLMIKV